MILHLARRSDWDAAKRNGDYRVSTRGAALEQIGFIHASFPHQLTKVAEYIYAGMDDELCVLVMDAETIRAAGTPVQVEDSDEGEGYPHIYGPIEPAWVTEVRSARFDSGGRFEF